MRQHRRIPCPPGLGRGKTNEQSYPYFSAVRFQFSVSKTTGTQTWTYAAGTSVKAFNYAQGQSLAGAGFASGNATPLDTNLIKQSETVAGENVKIYGLSFMLSSDSDAELARQIFANVSCKLGLNGDQQLYQLGPLTMLPGGGGLHGRGRTYAAESPLNTQFAEVGSISNGLPGAANFYRFPTPILWRPPGGADATLTITCTCERAISFTTVDRTAVAGGAGTQGTTGYTAPATAGNLGTYVTGWFILHSVTKMARSQNA